MPQYTVTDDSGVSLTLEGDSPPTEKELEDIFSKHGKPQEVQIPQETIPTDSMERAARDYYSLPPAQRFTGEPVKGVTEPFVPIPRVEGDSPVLRAMLTTALRQPPTEQTAATTAAALNKAKEFIEFSESPLGGLAALAGGAGGPIAQKLIGLGFAGQMASQVPESARQAGTASVTGTPQQKAEAYIGLGANVALPALLSTSARTLPKTVKQTLETLTERIPDATQERIVQESNQPEHIGTEAQRQTAETGGGNRPVGSETVSPQEAQVGVPPEVPLASPETVTKETPSPEPAIEQPKVGEQSPVEGVVGMGGATPEELPGGKTSLKNAMGELERVSRDFPEATPTQKQAMATSWVQAGEDLKANPKAGDAIVQELKNNPSRGLTDVESATLLRHKVAVENALNDAAERTITSKTDAERAVAQDEHARLSDQLLEILDMAKERGSQWGREGRWRQALSDEDFSLSTMEARTRQSLGGRKLTDSERGELVGLSKKIQDADKALNAVKTRIANRIKELQQKIEQGDFSKKVRIPTLLDNEGLRAKATLERLKQDFREGLERNRLEKRSPGEKVKDFIGRWRREFVLSGINSLYKLTAAALQGLIVDPIKEAAGVAVGKVLPRFAERTELERPSSVGIEAKAWTQAFSHILDDTGKILRTGKSNLEAAYGGKNAIPSDMKAYMGRLHALLKSPLRRQAWTRSAEILARDYLAKGIDVHDPLVQMEIGAKAYRQSDRALFLENNMVVDAYKRLLSTFEKPKAGQEHLSVGQIAGGTALKLLLPIIKIPTNLVSRTFQAGFGGFTGAGRLALAYAKGIEKLPPEKADSIMRQLKAGSIGGAAMMLGFVAPELFGGYYEPGKKRQPGELKPGELKIAGVTIPPYLQHRPELQIAQFGATVRHVLEERVGKDTLNNKNISDGALAASLGLLEETPFINEMLNLGKLRQQPKKYLGAEAADIVTPQLVQQLAKMTDKDEFGNPVRRNPQTFGEQLKSGIPGLRREVPVKVKK